MVRLARGVGVFLLAVVVMEPQHNFYHFVAIISNSPFLLLVSVNTILVLNRKRYQKTSYC